MLLKSKKLSLVAVLALLGATLVAQPAWAATVNCSTSGTFTITNNVVTGNTNCAGAAVIPSGVTSIGFDAFRAGELTSITIPNSVTSIGGNAFLQARALTSINIGNSVTSIGNAAFYEASSLETVTFAAGSVLDSIGNYAFQGTTSLESITIPNSVTSIGMQAFAGTTSLTSITFEGNAPGAVGTNVFLLAGTNAVANIGSAATGFGDGTTWNGLTIVRAEDTTLPTVTPVTEETSAGATLVINGTNMDRITKVTIGGTVVSIAARTKTSITVTVPAGLAAGNYTIVLTTVEATALAGGFANVVAGEPEVATNQKVTIGTYKGYVAVFTKGYAGQKLSVRLASKWHVRNPIVELKAGYSLLTVNTGAGYVANVIVYIDGVEIKRVVITTR